MSVHFHGEEGVCSFCGAIIRWARVAGRPKPFDADGTSHFQTCRVWREKCAAADAKKKAQADERQGKLFP